MMCPPHTYLVSDDAAESRIVLGEGSFATVFLGEIEENQRLVAIKQMKETFLSVPHAMADFLSEIGKLRQMKHKNIIEFLGAEKVNGVLNTYNDFDIVFVDRFARISQRCSTSRTPCAIALPSAPHLHIRC